MSQERNTPFGKETESLPFTYDYYTGPHIVTPGEVFEWVENDSEGKFPINCQLYAASVTVGRGFVIPPHYRSSEILEDPEGVLKEVSYQREPPQEGDIIGLSRAFEAPKNIHLGIIRIDKGKPVTVVHASLQAGGVEKIPLSKLVQERRYQTIRFIKRAGNAAGRRYHPDVLTKIGFSR